jgi:Rrf2 family transcriptional regulator, cysteine metabolism repressor
MRAPCLDTRTYYSLKCLVCLAEAGSPRRSKQLAELTGIAPSETAKMLSLLAWGGFLSSKRGAKGGFWLRRHPAEIRVGDVVKFLEPPVTDQVSVGDDDFILRIWLEKVGTSRQKFEKLSLADLLRESHRVNGPKKRAGRIQ